MARGNFEVSQSLAGLPPAEEIIDSMPPARLGHWAEHEKATLDEASCTSLDFAKTIQLGIKGRGFEEQKLIIADMVDELDRLAEDVIDSRAAADMGDGYISGDIGGYSVTGESRAIVALRMYEVAHGVKYKADYKKDGVRLAGPVLVPVLAVRSLALIRS